MTDSAKTAVLPEELQAVQRRWLELSRKEQDELYAREFAVPFARLFAKLPLHGAPEGMERPRALISVLGFSWQPVALMAAWAQPKRVLVLGTQESLSIKVDGEGVLSLVSRVSGVPRDNLEPVRVGDPGESDIYRAVRDFLRHSGIPPRQIFVDPTGGKKSMSASAALAGFLAGAPLVYVDYARYHGPNRIPVAGTEFPRLLTNPLEVLGDLELRDIFAAFNRSDFSEAKNLADRLASRLYEPREAGCLSLLAEGYGAWDRFDFKRASEALREAQRQLDAFATQGRWNWAGVVRETLERNLKALDVLKETREKPERIDDGCPLLVWYLAAAGRLLQASKPSLALLLIYAAVERYVDLCLWTEFGLDDEKPDYSLVENLINREQYDKAGRVLFDARYKARDLEGPLMLMNGAQLLAVLNPNRLSMNDLGRLKGLSAARNKCEYEHGFLPRTPDTAEVQQYLKKATEIVTRICGQEALEKMLEGFRFPVLTPSA